MRFVKKEEIIDSWSVLIGEAEGKAENIFENTNILIDQTKAPNVKKERKKLAPGIVRGLFGNKREFMVVSETGARLSPNADPDRMAANRMTGSAPRITPAGNISAQNAMVVPYPVPTAVAKTAASKKVTITHTDPSNPVAPPSQTNPLTRPPAARILANMPAQIQQITAMTPNGILIPSNMAWQ